MRSLAYLIVVLAACKVPDKIASDGGTVGDGPPDSPHDTTVPDTTIDSGPADFSNQRQVTFEFSSDKPNVTFQCRIDADDPAPCTSPFVRTLTDGSHDFAVRASDQFGNSDDTPAEKAWTIDTVAPQTTLLSAPPHADNSTSAVFEFNSNEMNVTFECSLDSGGFAACVSGQVFSPIVDGAHSFSVRAADRAGNVDQSSVGWAWNVDTSTPDTQILTGPVGSVPVTNATFTFDSPDAGAGATFQCSLDGSAFIACTSPHNLVAMTEGTHTFEVRVRDAVGNFDPSPATRTWIVDLSAPDTTILTGPTGTVPVASASITFTATEAPVTFACSLDGAAPVACTSPFVVMELAQGPHTFTVRATDMAGHADPTPATQSWTVDTIAPDIQITAGPDNGATSGPRVTFAFTASEGAATCSFDGGAFGPCTSPIATNLNAAAHQFSVSASDGAGNVTTVTRAWTVACVGGDPTGAVGVLHLDDTGQALANAVAGGAGATLGDTEAVEPGDPTPVAGRFAGALSFDAAGNTHVAWPAALGFLPAVSVELWAAPTAAGVLVVSGDNRFTVGVGMASPTTVRFSASLGDAPGPATSAPVATNTWHHVLVSFQDSVLHLWVDGVRTDVTNIQPTTAYAFDSVRLGGDATTAYTGRLDEVWLSSSAITTDEAALARYCPL